MNYYVPLLPEKFYHIFNRANGSEKLFINDHHYRFFLLRFEKYIDPVAQILVYNLLPNHFHFIIRVRPADALRILFRRQFPHRSEDDDWQSKFVMQQFSNLFNSYAKSFNKMNARKGSLFMDYMKRVEIKTDEQLSAAFFYVHKNAVHHGLCDKITDWPWSSYHSILFGSTAKIEREFVLDWFGDTNAFVAFHSQSIELKSDLALE